MQLTNTQKNAVDQIVNEFDLDKKTQIYFKAPTGSGKTFMIANVINDLAQKYYGQKLIFVIATLSSGELPKQMENNLNDYSYYLPFWRANLKLERVESPSQKDIKVKDYDYRILAEENKVFILGSSSFGKNRILTERGAFDSFLQQIKDENYKLVYIRDEAHYGSEDNSRKAAFSELDEKQIQDQNFRIDDKNVEKKFEALIQKAAHYIIKMTATPKLRNIKQIEITQEMLRKDSIKLIKSIIEYNDGIGDIEKKEIDDLELLNKACEKFNQIKEQYANSELEPSLFNINPAMLIQISDKTSKNSFTFEDDLEEIKKTLEKHNLTWAQYFSNDKKTSNTSNIREDVSLKSISKNTSAVDCIIFKVGPATGWNIPRACMLVQLRKVSSENLSIQTIGRIKRNPNPTYSDLYNAFDYENSIANKYWIYSSFVEKNKKWSYYLLQDEFKKNSDITHFYHGQINKDLLKEIMDSEKYRESIIELLDEKMILASFKEFKQYYDASETDKNKPKYLAAEEEELKYGEFNNSKNYKDFGKSGKTRLKVNRKITNIVELELYVSELFKKYSMFLNKPLIARINNWIDTFINQNSENNKENQVSRNLIWFIIYKKLIEKIKAKFIECKKSTVEKNANVIEYMLTKNYTSLPENQYQWDSEMAYFEFTDKNDEKLLKYAYVNANNADPAQKHKHYLDSINESTFLDNLRECFIKLWKSNNSRYDKLVSVWSKNPALHGVSYEYYSEDNDVKSSFPDLIIKFGKHQLIIEIKDDNKDYSTNKTSAILEAYKNYIQEEKEKNISLNKMDNQTSLTLMICYVDKDDIKGPKKIRIAGASTNEIIDRYIEENEYKKEAYSFIEEIVNNFKNLYEVTNLKQTENI